mgnify:CR=1 FL=1
MKQLVTSMFFTLALLLPLGQAQAADEEIRALAKEVSDKILARTDKRRAELKAHPERLPDALRTALGLLQMGNRIVRARPGPASIRQ